METLTAKSFRFSNFELDSVRRVLLKDGEPVALKPKAFDLLLVLIESRGEVLTKDDLLERVWPGQFVEEGNLKVHVSTLRKVLGERKDEHRYIVTVPGSGYSFVAELDGQVDGTIVVESHLSSTIIIEENGFDSGHETAAIANVSSPKVSGVSRTRLLQIGLGALVLGALLAGAYVWQRRNSTRGATAFDRLQMKRLTTNGKVQLAALSSDGTLFVYALGTSGHPKSLWLGHTAGGEPVELRPPSEGWYHSLHFSPDNSSVYYVFAGSGDSDGGLYRLRLLGGVPEMLSEKIRTHVAFSPDMTQIAFVKNDRKGQASTIVVSDLNGGNAREVASRPLASPLITSTPTWSPDGKALAVGAVIPNANEAESEIIVIDPANGTSRSLTNPVFREMLSLAWSKDPNGVMVVANQPPLFDAQLWHVSYPGGEIRQVDLGLGAYRQSLGVSEKGDTVLGVQLSTLANIWVAPANDLSNARQITFGTTNSRAGMYGLDWLPDGRIVYGVFADKQQSLWISDSDGRNQRRLTPDAGIAQQPSVSSDGGVIVFVSNRSGASEIWRVDGNGNNLRQITSGGRNDMPAISPDGKWVVYVSRQDGGSRLWRVSIDGGAPIKLSDRDATWPRISPDGSQIACATTSDGKTYVMMMPANGGSPPKLFHVPKTANFRWSIRWTPDGQAIAYRDWEQGYWRQPISGGPPERLEGLPEEKLFAFAWSPDDKQFAFSRGPETRDVVLLQETAK